MSTLNELRAIDTALRDTLENCNDMMLGIPAETFKELPQRIGETISSATNNGYNTGFGAGFASGEQSGMELGVETGKQMAYDEFWDLVQNNGELMAYTYAFNNSNFWNEITFKPKYPLRPSTATYMFYGNKRIPLLPVAVDFSQCSNMSYCFCSTRFQRLPVIDMRKVASTLKQQSVFYGNENLTSIEKIYLHGGDYGDSFEKLTSLVEIRVEGEFVSNLNMGVSPLSRASIESIVAALSDTKTGLTLTLKQSAVEAAFTTEEWETLAATKPNWTIALA